jgi:hypothetical protein
MSPLQQETNELEEHLLALLEKVENRHAFLHEFLSKLSPEGQHLVQKLINRPQAPARQMDLDFANAIGARQLDPVEEQALEFASLVNLFDYRRSLLSNSISSPALANLLGVSRQTIHDRFKSGQLLGMLDNNVLKFPNWQFDPSGPNGVVNGLPEVLATLQCSAFAKISWLSTCNPVFSNLRPIDVLKTGKVDEVIREARSVGVA